MINKSKFIKKYKKEMKRVLLGIYPNMNDDDINNTLDEMIKKNLRNPVVTLDNNYTGEQRDSTLLSVLDWVIDRKPIICGNATFYKNQYESINPIAKMLEGFLSDRKMYKKMMFSIDDTSSARYKDLDRSQLNEKINANSYYGASGAPSSAFYSEYNGPATTNSAQQVISTAETLFEGFIADNYTFLNLTEALEWIENVIKPFREDKEPVDDFIRCRSLFDVKDRIYNKILDKEENDEKILEWYLDSFSDQELSIIYYKNNMLEFIDDHQEIQSLIIEIFENVENLTYASKDDNEWFANVVPKKYKNEAVCKDWEEWNKFVNIQYFMDPNNVPESIANTLYVLKNYFMKYIYCKYLSPDRIYRLKNFKRRVVTVIDTDSNILSLDTSVDHIFDNILNGRDFGRSFKNNIFICVNMLAYILTEAVTDILLTYGEHSNIPEEYRPIYNMKNEFLFLKLVIGETKKRYISKIVLREGNLMNPPKYDIKGLKLKTPFRVIYMENKANCWELSLSH